jgi:hypothetical protein
MPGPKKQTVALATKVSVDGQVQQKEAKTNQAGQPQHIFCGGCPTCKPTDLSRDNSAQKLADDIPPPPPIGIGPRGPSISADSSPGSGDIAAKASSLGDKSNFNAQPEAKTLEGAGNPGAQAYTHRSVATASIPAPVVRADLGSSQGLSAATLAGERTVKIDTVAASVNTTASLTAAPSQPLSRATSPSFTTNQPAQSFSASGAIAPTGAQTSTTNLRTEINTEARPASLRSPTRDEPQQTPVTHRSEPGPAAVKSATGEASISLRHVPEGGSRGVVNTRAAVDEPRAAPNRNENPSAERVVQSRVTKQGSMKVEQRGELVGHSDTPTRAISSTMRVGSRVDAIRRDTARGDVPPRDDPKLGVVNGDVSRGSRLPSEPKMRVATRYQTTSGEVGRGNNVRSEKVLGDTVMSATMRANPVRSDTARGERYMGWAADRNSSSQTHQVRPSSGGIAGREPRSESALHPRHEARPSQVIRDISPTTGPTSGRSDKRPTTIAEQGALSRRSSKPVDPATQRVARSFAESPLAPTQRQVQMSANSRRQVTDTVRRETSVATGQDRVVRRESVSQERMTRRQETSVTRKDPSDSRLQRRVERSSDRGSERLTNAMRSEKTTSRRGETATRNTEGRSGNDRAAALQRSNLKSKELSPSRAAALRQAIFDRINRIVASAERVRRSGRVSLGSIQQLELATRIIEVLGEEEEYAGISELRSRELTPQTGSRAGRRRKIIKGQDREQQRARIKSLRELKKQRAARKSAGAGGVATQGAPQGGGGITAGAGAAPSASIGKIVSASRGGPSKSLDIFQAKSDDETDSDDLVT